MHVTVGLARLAIAFRWYDAASHTLGILIKPPDRGRYAGNNLDNISGIIEKSAYNAKFMTNAKILDPN